MSARVILGLGLLLALAATEARAEEDRQAPPEHRRGREEAFRMVDAYMVANLQESLGLTDEQYAQAIPRVKELQSARRDFVLERRRALRQLRSLLRSGSATEAQVLESLDAVKKVDSTGPERIRSATEALDTLLTPLQQAKYRVFELEVEQRMRDLMGRVRRERSKTRSPKP